MSPFFSFSFSFFFSSSYFSLYQTYCCLDLHSNAAYCVLEAIRYTDLLSARMFGSLTKKKHSLKHSTSATSSASSSSSYSTRAHISGPTSVSINGSAIGKNPQQQTTGFQNHYSHHIFKGSDAVDRQDSTSPIQLAKTNTSIGAASTTSSTSSRVPTLSSTADLKPNETNSINSNPPVLNTTGTRLMHSPSTSSLSSNTSSLSSFSSQKVIDQVRALYSYSSEKAHSLSFQKGDVLRVLLKLESGWWDGVNAQGQRGWFPSNYTTPIPFEPSESSSLSTSSLGHDTAIQSVVKNTEFDATTVSSSSSKSEYNESKSISSGVDSTNDYKYVEVTLDSVKSNFEPSNTNRISQTSSAGKPFCVSPTTKLYNSSLPFSSAAISAIGARPTEPALVSVTHPFIVSFGYF